MKIARSAALAAMMCMSPPALADDLIDLPLITDIPVSAGFERSIPDIVGIHFGDSIADARAALEKAYPDAVIDERWLEPGVRDGRGNGVYFKYLYQLSLRTYGTPSEGIVVRFTSTATGARVFQIERLVNYPSDQYGSMEELRASIAAKYGTPTLVELYPHQNRDEVKYTWEKRAIEPFPEQDVSKRSFSQPRPESVNVCLGAAQSSGYGSSVSEPQVYSFYKPGKRSGNRGWDVCIGGIEFIIFYGNNPKTVGAVRIKGTDYDRSMQDALTLDELLSKLLDERANAASGEGAPTL